jgi:hypothetical protein
MHGLAINFTSHWEFTFIATVFLVGIGWVFYEAIKTEAKECGLCEFVKKLFEKK